MSDFFLTTPSTLGGTFDAVIGNPPYVRYHRFRGELRQRGLRAAAAGGVHLNGLASSWAPFVVHATQFLSNGGRLALVLPAELLHVDYAAPIRDFLLRRFGSVTVFTFQHSVFPGATIDAVLLFAQDGAAQEGLRLLTLKDLSELHTCGEGIFEREPANRWSRHRGHIAGAEQIERLRTDSTLIRLSDVASVDIGFVSGANDFFLLSRADPRHLHIPRRVLQPVIARPAHLRGAIASRKDLNELSENEKHFLVRLKKPGLDTTSSAIGRYLRKGREMGIQERYKCRVRRPWYMVPGVRVPHVFLSYMSHRAPRIALNQGGFSSTNLVHHITFKSRPRYFARAVVSALYSSIAQLSFELEGRSYGGGVLKLETREAERVYLPALDPSLHKELSALLIELDVHLRNGRLDLGTELVDQCLLRNGVLDSAALAAIRTGRDLLRERRSSRSRTKPSCR